MPQFPTYRDTCGLTFLSGINVESTSNLSLQGNFTRCPRCSSFAKVVEGTFDISSNPDPTFTQTAGEPVDAELFTRLGLILVAAQLEGLSPQAIIEKIGPHSPRLAKRLGQVAGDPKAFAAALATLISVIGAIAVAMIISHHPPASTIIKNYFEFRIQPSEGEMDRTRRHLWKLREKNTPLPSWVKSYIGSQGI